MAQGQAHSFFLLQFSCTQTGVITRLPHSQVPGLDAGSCVKHVSTKLHWQFDFVIQDISYCQCDFVMWEISC